MQTPCKTDSGRMARELFLWIPTLVIMAGLWIGCGEKTAFQKQLDREKTVETSENSNEGSNPGANTENTEAPSSGGQPEEQPSVAQPVTQPVANPAAGSGTLASHLPEKMTMLLSANLKQLLDKGGHKEFLKSEIFEQIMAEINDELAISILKDPAASGLDVAQPAHVFLNVLPPTKDDDFGEPLVEGGLLMAVKNAATLEKTINKIIQATGLPMRVTQAKGFNQVAMAGMPVALGFTDQVFVIVGTSDEAKVLQVPAMLEARINGNYKLGDSLSAHLKKKYDLGAWFDYNQLMGIMEAAMGDQDGQELSLAPVQEDVQFLRLSLCLP